MTNKTYIATFTSKSKYGNGETVTTELFTGSNVKEARKHADFFKRQFLHSRYSVKIRLHK